MSSDSHDRICRIVDARHQQNRRDDDRVEHLLCAPTEQLDRSLDRIAGTILQRRKETVVRGMAKQGRFAPSIVDDGYLMGVFSHFSVVFGVPVFLVPMVLRDNTFALHHARAAGVIYLVSLLFVVLAVTNCAIFLPLVFVCYIPALIGIYRASAGVEAGTSALGPAGQRLFGWIEVKQ